MNIQKLNKMGMRLNKWSYYNTNWGMSEPTYELSLSSHPGGASARLVWLVVGSPVLNIFLLDILAGHTPS